MLRRGRLLRTWARWAVVGLALVAMQPALLDLHVLVDEPGVRHELSTLPAGSPDADATAVAACAHVDPVHVEAQRTQAVSRCPLGAVGPAPRAVAAAGRSVGRPAIAGAPAPPPVAVVRWVAGVSRLPRGPPLS
jgi:hypothetical protein